MATKYFNLDIDNNLGGENSSDNIVASQKAIKTYIDNEIDKKQDKLTTGNGIEIEDNKISTNTQFVITEDMFDIEYDDTKGVEPYSTSYGYTNVTIHENAGIEWVNGAIYSFVLDTKTATTDNRNVRLRIGESGDWKPLMGLSSTIASGYTFFVKTRAIPFQYKSTYIEGGALHTMYYDTDTTYTINYLYDAGRYHAGTGAYAISRYSLVLQKTDGTWEKCTNTTKTYSTATTKTVNNRGFLLNQIKYYRSTSNYANGALVTANYLCSQYKEVNGAYSFNCGTAPSWAVGDYIYLVGTVKDDGLFYLDETKWWDNKLPTTNDGKIYIQLGSALTTTDATMTFLNDRPILYHDGNKIVKYIENDISKQDVITDLDTIKSNAEAGKSAKDTIDTYGDIVTHNTDEFQIAGDYATKTELEDGLNAKQDTIKDLEQIRNNAYTGASLAPQVEVNTQRIEDLTVSKFPNATPIGNPTVQDSYVSGFSSATYMQFPFTDISKGLPFDIYFSFTTSDDVTTQQNILDSYFGIAVAIANSKGLMAISTNGTNWESGSIIGTNSINPNTTYYAKLSWTGEQYTTAISIDNQTYIPDMVYNNNNSPHKTTIYIGSSPNIFGAGSSHPFKGTINFKGARVYLPTLDITVWEGMADVGLASRANVSLNNLDEVGEQRFTNLQNDIDTKANSSDLTTHTSNTTIHITASDKTNWNGKADDNAVVHKTGSESITGQKIFKLNNTYANNTLDAIFSNGIFIGDGNSSTTSRLFNTRWCNNAFQIKTSQDIGYSYLAGSTSTNYGLKYQVQRMPSRSAYPTGAGVVEAGMVLSYDGLIVGYSEQANKKVEDNEFTYVLDQKSVKTKTIDTLQTTDKTIIGAINEIANNYVTVAVINGLISRIETLEALIQKCYTDSD